MCPAPVCGNGFVEAGEECDPAGPASPQCGNLACEGNCQCCDVTGAEGPLGTCNDAIDNDCDGLIDCTDPGCAPALCNGGTQNGQSCSTQATIDACVAGGGSCTCPAIQKDPTTIKFGPPGAGLDRFKSHGRVELGGTVDVGGAEVRWLVTNNVGRVFETSLPAGAFQSNAAGTSFRYLNKAARSQGGVYKAKIRITRGGISYGYKVEAYGDCSAATDPDMAIQFYIGNQLTPAIHREMWKRTGTGWKAQGFD
jgi:hypothetical protein